MTQVIRHIHDRETLAVGTHRTRLDLISQDVGLQWILHSAAGEATIEFYMAMSDKPEVLADLDPSSNPYWAPVPGPVAGAPHTFPTNPAGAIGTDVTRICGNIERLLIQVTVTTELADFSLISRVQEAV